VPGAKIMWPTAVLASALVRSALVLTTKVSGANGGGGGGGGGGGEGSGGGGRRPQSVQSVPRLQSEDSAPGPPSSQNPSEAYAHVSVQAGAICSSRRWLGDDGDFQIRSGDATDEVT
jgi:hypothetical protein